MTFSAFDFSRSNGTLRWAAREMAEPFAVLTYYDPSGRTWTDMVPFDLRGIRKHARQSLRRTSPASKRLKVIARLDITVFDRGSGAIPSGVTKTLFPYTKTKSSKPTTKSRRSRQPKAASGDATTTKVVVTH